SYYKDLRSALSTGRDINLNVHGLGLFRVKKKPLERKIQKTENVLNQYSGQDSLRAENIVKEQQETLSVLHSIREMLDDQERRRSEIEERKHQYYIENYGEHYQNLEKQG